MTVHREVVGRLLGERPLQDRAVAHERRADAGRGTEPLVRVDDRGVGQLETVVERCDAVVEDAGQPVGAVDVEPGTVLARDLTQRATRQATEHGPCRLRERALSGEHDVVLAMPPDLSAALVKLPRQSTLLLTVSMDAPEAAACHATDATTGATLIPDDRAVTACRLQFVVQEVAFRDPGGAGASEPPGN